MHVITMLTGNRLYANTAACINGIGKLATSIMKN